MVGIFRRNTIAFARYVFFLSTELQILHRDDDD